MEGIWTGIASGWKSKQGSKIIVIIWNNNNNSHVKKKTLFFAKSTLETVYFNGILLFNPSISAIALRMI